MATAVECCSRSFPESGLVRVQWPYWVVRNGDWFDQFELSLSGGFTRTALEMPGLDHLTVVHDPARPVSIPPKGHDGGSQTKYLFDNWPRGNDIYMLGALAPFGHTSIHFHPAGISEIYKIYVGELHLFVDGQEVVLKGSLRDGLADNSTYIVRPGQVHQSCAGNSTVLVGICLVGAALIPPDQWHNRDHR